MAFATRAGYHCNRVRSDIELSLTGYDRIQIPSPTTSMVGWLEPRFVISPAITQPVSLHAKQESL